MRRLRSLADWLRRNVKWVELFGLPLIFLAADFYLRTFASGSTTQWSDRFADASADLALLAVGSFYAFAIDTSLIPPDQVRSELVIRGCFFLLFFALWVFCVTSSSDMSALAIPAGPVSFYFASVIQMALAEPLPATGTR